MLKKSFYVSFVCGWGVEPFSPTYILKEMYVIQTMEEIIMVKEMTKDASFSIRIPSVYKEALKQLAEKKGTSASNLACEIIEKYLMEAAE